MSKMLSIGSDNRAIPTEYDAICGTVMAQLPHGMLSTT